MKKMLMIGTISLIAISSSVSLIGSPNLNVINNTINLDESNENNSISVADGEYTIVNNLDVYNEGVDKSSTSSLFYVSDTKINWDFYVYDSDGNRVEDAYLKTDIQDISRHYATNGRIFINENTEPTKFYLYLPSDNNKKIDLGYVVTKTYLNSFNQLVEENNLVTKNSLKVFKTETENVYNYQFKLNTNIQYFSSYIKNITFLFSWDSGNSMANYLLQKQNSNGLFVEQTDWYQLILSENSTTIKLNSFEELSGVDFFVSFSNGNLMPKYFELPSIITTSQEVENSKNTLYAIDSENYINKNNVSYVYDKNTKIFTLNGVNYLDENGNSIIENIYLHITISYEDESLEDYVTEIKMNYNESNDSYYLNLDTEYIQNSENQIKSIMLDQIIISNPNGSNKISSEESIIDVIRTNNVEVPVNTTETESSSDSYVWVGILGALLGLIILILIYIFFKHRRNSRLDENDTDQTNSDSTIEVNATIERNN